MCVDRSEGWEAVAAQFMAARSRSGASLVQSWAAEVLPPSAAVVDIGCGAGVPIGEVLIANGCTLFGIDASPTLAAAFHQRFPDAAIACEAAQCSDFFGRRFDAAVCIGLLFLLAESDQREVVRRVGEALKMGGRFLFTAPRERCEWLDLLTGRPSWSLGEAGYRALLGECGLQLVACRVDEGGNHYFDAVKVTRRE